MGLFIDLDQKHLSTLLVILKRAKFVDVDMDECAGIYVVRQWLHNRLKPLIEAELKIGTPSPFAPINKEGALDVKHGSETGDQHSPEAKRDEVGSSSKGTTPTNGKTRGRPKGTGKTKSGMGTKKAQAKGKETKGRVTEDALGNAAPQPGVCA